MMATNLLIASLNCAEAEEKGKTERLEGGVGFCLCSVFGAV